MHADDICVYMSAVYVVMLAVYVYDDTYTGMNSVAHSLWSSYSTSLWYLHWILRMPRYCCLHGCKSRIHIQPCVCALLGLCSFLCINHNNGSQLSGDVVLS